MANEKLKFYRRSTAPANPQEGYIWFNSSNGVLAIYKSSKWEYYSGLVDATYTNNKLTITKKDGVEKVEVDLSALSSISGLTSRLGAVEGNITTLSTAVNTMTGIVDAIPATVSTEVTTQLDALDATVWSTGGNTAPDFKTNANKNKRVAVKVVQTNGEITGVEVLENDIATATSVGDVNDRIDVLVGDDTGSIRDIARNELAAQLLSGKADDDFKTLEQLAAWLEDHPEDVAEINQAISDLQGKVNGLPTNYITKFGGKTGEITVKGGQDTNGSVNLVMSNNQLQASIVGLGTAAYAATSAFDASGSATSAETAAKAYADSLLTWAEY